MRWNTPPTPGALARVRVVVSRSVITSSAPSAPLAGTSRLHRLAAYTRCLRCAGAPRRPARGSELSLHILSCPAVPWAPRAWSRALPAHSFLACRPLGPRGIRTPSVPDSDVGMAFAANKPARHSQRSRNPFHAGGEFRGYLVRTIATACQVACPPLPRRPIFRSPPGGFYFQAFNRSVSLPVAGYDYNSDWTSSVGGTLTR